MIRATGSRGRKVLIGCLMIIGRNRTMPNQIDCRTKIGRPKGSSRGVSVTTIDMSAGMSPRVESCEVCIVGAGIAGLNALFVASRYLSRDQRVILIDRREGVGGMWVDTYPYVRLHQPHGMFTAGNIKWTLGQDRSYLATKGEVLEHF